MTPDIAFCASAPALGHRGFFCSPFGPSFSARRPKLSTPIRHTQRRSILFTLQCAIPDKWDTIVIGSGPVGSTIAKYLAVGGTGIDPNGNAIPVPGDQRVLMVDAGQKLAPRAGDHVKNSLLFQADHGEGRRLFAQFIASTIEPISRTPSPSSNPTAFPSTWQDGVINNPDDKFKNFSPNLTNPDQEEYFNLPGAAIGYKVGGMGTHWTCSTPRPHPIVEMNDLFPSDPLYEIGERLLKTNSNSYDNEVRNVLVGEELRNMPHLQQLLGTKYGPQDLPLAVTRRNDQYVDWTGTSAILEDLSTRNDENFMIAEQLVCLRLEYSDSKVTAAVLHDPRGLYTPDGQPGEFKVFADNFVVACGQVHSAQLLAASGFTDLVANGRYLTEQPFMFTRIILQKEIIDKLRHLDNAADPLYQFKEVIDEWSQAHPDDPIPIPRSGAASGEVQQWIPVSERRPWHVQIHNDNFYGQNLNTGVDDRLIVGLRWFTVPAQVADNKVTFSDTNKDYMGMPQPTFDYTFRRGDITIVNDAHKDLLQTMEGLGAPVPGGDSEVQFLENGSALHLHGCNRIGRSKSESVANENGLVWDRDNLYVAGNGTIPKGIACNPTLTSVCLAIRTCMAINGMNTSGTFADIDRKYVTVNPKSW